MAPHEAHTTLHPGSRLIEARRFTTGAFHMRHEAIAEEVPVALIYNEFTFVVMLATPVDLEDFGIGFSLTEGIIGSIHDISQIETVILERGIEVRLTITEDLATTLRGRRRNLTGGTGCGLCGTDSFGEALRPIPRVISTQRFAPPAICQAMAAFPRFQVLNQNVGAVHAAAFVDADGNVIAVREDVGRHNALDKVIGFLARGTIDPAAGFIAVSSRCSYEMIHKTAAAGIPLIASVSAPTTLAIEFAEKVQVGLAAFAREGRFTVYAVPSRIQQT